MHLLISVNTRIALVQGLAAFSTTCPQRDEVALFLDKLCHSLLKDPKQLHRMLLHDLGGPMMLEAAQGGLPHNSAIRASPELFANPTRSPVHCVLKPEQSYRNQALCSALRMDLADVSRSLFPCWRLRHLKGLHRSLKSHITRSCRAAADSCSTRCPGAERPTHGNEHAQKIFGARGQRRIVSFKAFKQTQPYLVLPASTDMQRIWQWPNQMSANFRGASFIT